MFVCECFICLWPITPGLEESGGCVWLAWTLDHAVKLTESRRAQQSQDARQDCVCATQTLTDGQTIKILQRRELKEYLGQVVVVVVAYKISWN